MLVQFYENIVGDITEIFKNIHSLPKQYIINFTKKKTAMRNSTIDSHYSFEFVKKRYSIVLCEVHKDGNTNGILNRT